MRTALIREIPEAQLRGELEAARLHLLSASVRYDGLAEIYNELHVPKAAKAPAETLDDRMDRYVSEARAELMAEEFTQRERYFNRSCRDRIVDRMVRAAIAKGPLPRSDADAIANLYGKRLRDVRKETEARVGMALDADNWFMP